MNKTRTIALILCALLLLGCTTACNSEVTPTESTTLPQDVSASEKSWQDDGVLKILTIGNSFSDDTMQYVHQIALDAGVKAVKLGNLFIGGCTLDRHANNSKADAAVYDYRSNSLGGWSTTPNSKMSDAIRSENWDFISLQQASGSSGVPSTYAQFAYLVGYVRALCPDAKIVWNMTWAYQQDSTHSEFTKYGNDQMTMYNAILAAVEEKVKPNSAIYAIVPTGTAIQNARTSYVGDNLTRDGYHLSMDFGRYVAGLTFVHKLTGLSIDNVSYMPNGVDEDMRKIAIESATNAVKSPTEVTNSAYTDAPVFDESKYTKLEISWTAYGFWKSDDSANHHKVNTTASNSKSFYASEMFTKEDLPVGSVIEVASGWLYRPEAWKSEGVQTSRPDSTSTNRVVVTESWWGTYTHRAFNLSKTGSPSLEGAADEIETAFVIWIPKN